MNLTKIFMDDNIPKIEVMGSNFFVKTLRDGGSRLEIDLTPDEVPRLMTALQVINEDQKVNDIDYTISITSKPIC